MNHCFSTGLQVVSSMCTSPLIHSVLLNTVYLDAEMFTKVLLSTTPHLTHLLTKLLSLPFPIQSPRYLEINVLTHLSIWLAPGHVSIPYVFQTSSMSGHTVSQQHGRAATWLKLTSVARSRAAGARHSATSPPSTLFLYKRTSLYLSSCAHTCRRVFVSSRYVTKVAPLCLEDFMKQEWWPRCVNTQEENQRRTWSFRSQSQLRLPERCMWACVASAVHTAWCQTYKTDTRKPDVVLREKRWTEKEHTVETVSVWRERWERNYINKKKTDKQRVKTGRTKWRKNRQKWTSRQSRSRGKKIKRKQTQIGRERPFKTWPIFSSLVCILEQIKLTFFFVPEHGETESIVLPVHTYYFSKAPARRRKGRKRGRCLCARMYASFCSEGRDTQRIGKMSFAGKSRLWLRQKPQSHRGSNKPGKTRLCAHFGWNQTYVNINTISDLKHVANT